MEAKFLRGEEIKAFGDFLSAEVHPTFCQVIGCFDGEEPVGALVLDIVSETIALVEWIYVGESHREKGAAKCMVQCLADWAESNKFVIQANYAEDSLLNHLFVVNNFELELSEIPNYVLDMEKVEKVLDRAEANEDKGYEILPIEEVTEEQFVNLSDSLSEEEDEEIPISTEMLLEADPGMSRVYFKDGKINAMMYVKQLDEESVKISYIWSRGTEKMAPGILFTDVYRWMKKYEPEVKNIHFTGMASSVCKMVERVFGVKPVDYLRIITASYFGLGRNR